MNAIVSFFRNYVAWLTIPEFTITDILEIIIIAILLHRACPDVRQAVCKNIAYFTFKPSASIQISIGQDCHMAVAAVTATINDSRLSI